MLYQVYYDFSFISLFIISIFLSFLSSFIPIMLYSFVCTVCLAIIQSIFLLLNYNILINFHSFIHLSVETCLVKFILSLLMLRSLIIDSSLICIHYTCISYSFLPPTLAFFLFISLLFVNLSVKTLFYYSPRRKHQ